MLDLVIAWLPLVLIMVIIAITGQASMKSYARHVARVEEINKDLVATTQDMVAELREIKQLLRDQK